MPAAPTFVAPSPLALRAPAVRRARRAAAVCCAPAPRPASRPASRSLPNLTGAVAGALAIVFMPFATAPKRAQAAPKAAAPIKELRYDGRQELDGGEKAMSLTLTAGTFAALGVWAWKQNRRDDELENVRIKEEVERLEKLKAEFMDVEEDEESLDDEDLLASLKQRIEDSEDDDADDSEGGKTDVVAERSDDSVPPGDDDAKQPDETGSDVATSDSVDMLKRMWEATDDDQQKKDNKS